MLPKRSLGQNFLTAPMVAHTMVQAGEVTKDDVVLEIGPGKGALTRELLAHANRVIAVEKDDDLYLELQDIFHAELASDNLVLIHGDILELDLAQYIQETPYKVLANIPYNITGALIKKLLTAPSQPTCIVLLVQKEVAQRIVAKDGKESILSLSVKVFGEPRYVQTVKAGSFYPKPNVDSAVIALTAISRKHITSQQEEEKFFTLIKAGFAQKRKTLRNNLTGLFGDKVSQVLHTCNIFESARAEDLTLDDWLKLLQHF